MNDRQILDVDPAPVRKLDTGDDPHQRAEHAERADEGLKIQRDAAATWYLDNHGLGGGKTPLAWVMSRLQQQPEAAPVQPAPAVQPQSPAPGLS